MCVHRRKGEGGGGRTSALGNGEGGGGHTLHLEDEDDAWEVGASALCVEDLLRSAAAGRRGAAVGGSERKGGWRLERTLTLAALTGRWRCHTGTLSTRRRAEVA